MGGRKWLLNLLALVAVMALVTPVHGQAHPDWGEEVIAPCRLGTPQCWWWWRQQVESGKIALPTPLSTPDPTPAHDPDPTAVEPLEPIPLGPGVVVTETGVVMPVLDVAREGYTVTTPCRNEAFVTTGSYLRHVDVVLDPGHGGRDSGAVGPNGLLEKDLNLKVAEAAAQELEARGYSVLLTRNADYWMAIQVRAEIGLSVLPEAFVSVHHNAGATRSSSTPGTEIYHQADNPEARRLAGLIYEEVHQALSRFDAQWRFSVFQGANSVIRQRDKQDLYGILRHTPGLASVITEAAYLSTRSEARLLSDPVVQAAEGAAIANGIIRFLRTDDPGSGYNGTTVTNRRLPSSGNSRCADPPFDIDRQPE